MAINLETSLLMNKANNISFGKKNKKNKEQEKTQNRIGNDSGYMSKARNAAVRSYAKAALYGGLALGAPAMTMTSCIQQDQEVNIDTKQFTDMLLKLIEQQKEGNEQTKKLLMELLAAVKDGNLNSQQALDKLIQLVGQLNKNDADLMLLITKISEDSKLSAEERTQKIIAAIQEVGKQIESVKELIKVLGDNMTEGNKELISKFESWVKEYEKNEIDRKELMDKVFNELVTSNNLNKEQSELIKTIIANGEAQGKALSEIMNQILSVLQSIDGKLDGLKEAVDGLGDKFVVNGEKLSDLLKEQIDLYKDEKIKSEEFRKNIMDYINKSNVTDEKFLAIMNKISEQIANGQLTMEQGLGQITQGIKDLNARLEKIQQTLEKLSTDFSNFAEQTLDKQDKSFNMLQNIHGTMQEVNATLKDVKKNQDETNKTLIRVADTGDQILAQMSEMNQKMFTKDEIKVMLGDAYEFFKTELGKISGNQVTYEQMEEIMNKYKTDLTKTNALIETLTTVVQNMNNGSAELSEILAVLREIKTGSAESMQKVLEKLANIEGGLNALLTVANSIKSNQESFMSSATTFGTKMMEEVQKISNNMINKDVFATYAEGYKESMLKAEQARQEEKILLQTIVEKMGSGNSVDIDAIIAKLPNYKDILNEISEKIGKVITSADLENFYLNTKPDLTKTNALIETLTTVVQNMNVGGGSGSTDTAELERIAGLILDAISSGQVADSQNYQKLIDLLKSIDAKVEAGKTDPTTKSMTASITNKTKKAMKITAREALRENMLYATNSRSPLQSEQYQKNQEMIKEIEAKTGKKVVIHNKHMSNRDLPSGWMLS